jgi:hypothetical protein
VTGSLETTACSTRDARIQRYAKVDLAQIRVVRARSDADLEIVSNLRAAGFARIASDNARQVEWIDETDRSPGVFSLIGYDPNDQPVATMRVQDERQAPLELRKFVPIDALLTSTDRPAAQFARLSVVKSMQATEAMFGLFKAAWSWCRDEGLRSIVIATPPWSKPIYDFMFFEHLGPDGEFAHEFAGGANHVVMKLPVQAAETIWRRGQSPLCKEFFDTAHPQLSL